MRRYILKRLLMILPTMLIISFICYGVMNMAPGDAVTYTSGIGFQDEEVTAARRAELGLDKPFVVRYANWLSKIVRGDLGTSYLFMNLSDQRDKVEPERVADIISKRLPYTLALNGAALVLSFTLCILVSVVLTTRRRKGIGVLISIIVFLGVSIPDFFLVLMIKTVFVKGGMGVNWYARNLGATTSLLDTLKFSITPVLVLCFTTIGLYVKYLRGALEEVIHENFILAARSRGISERIIIWKHVLRNSLLPLITAISLSLPALVGGSIIVETVWGWPGIGQYIVIASYARDYPLLMGTFMVIALLVVGGSILADLAYAIADPRITYK